MNTEKLESREITRCHNFVDEQIDEEKVKNLGSRAKLEIFYTELYWRNRCLSILQNLQSMYENAKENADQGKIDLTWVLSEINCIKR